MWSVEHLFLFDQDYSSKLKESINVALEPHPSLSPEVAQVFLGESYLTVNDDHFFCEMVFLLG